MPQSLLSEEDRSLCVYLHVMFLARPRLGPGFASFLSTETYKAALLAKLLGLAGNAASGIGMRFDSFESSFGLHFGSPWSLWYFWCGLTWFDFLVQGASLAAFVASRLWFLFCLQETFKLWRVQSAPKGVRLGDFSWNFYVKSTIYIDLLWYIVIYLPIVQCSEFSEFSSKMDWHSVLFGVNGTSPQSPLRPFIASTLTSGQICWSRVCLCASWEIWMMLVWFGLCFDTSQPNTNLEAVPTLWNESFDVHQYAAAWLDLSLSSIAGSFHTGRQRKHSQLKWVDRIGTSSNVQWVWRAVTFLFLQANLSFEISDTLYLQTNWRNMPLANYESPTTLALWTSHRLVPCSFWDGVVLKDLKGWESPINGRWLLGDWLSGTVASFGLRRS